MGNIGAHAEISHHVITQLKAVSPDEEWAYLELGNFMTDISQFRDPYAFMSAKPRILEGAMSFAALRRGFERHGVGHYYGLMTWRRFKREVLGPASTRLPFARLPLTRVKPWLDDLLGRPTAGRRHGDLAEFFEHIARFVTHMCFAEDSPLARAAFAATGIPSLRPLSVDEVNRIFGKAYTQYYPHEHLDFPPYKEGPDHRDDDLYKRGRRGLIEYLDEQLQFISEQLAEIELAWVSRLRLGRPATHPDRRDLLVQLGHVLHAVEDYYFHSNYIEVRQWNRLLKRYPLRDPESDYKFLLDHSLEGTRHAPLYYSGLRSTRDDPYSVLLRRRLARRLRYPIFVRGTEGDPKRSEDATGLIYTGGFAETDMFHTVHGALKAAEELLRKEKVTREKIVHSDLALIRTLFNEEERIRMVEDEDHKDDIVKEHESQLTTGTYIEKLTELEGRITVQARAALMRAFVVDRRLEHRYKHLPGVGSFLIEFMTLMQAETEHSHRIVERLNRYPLSVYYRGTVNGASAETIGMHSLMAKDSEHKEPLQAEAMALAKFASAAIAVVLVRRIKEDPSPMRGLDWDVLVRHFVRFPTVRRGTWDDEVLAAKARGDELPTLDEIRDKPRYRMLSMSDPKGKLKARWLGRKTQELEDRYESLERRFAW